ncbi:MAG TPA: 5-formyltetrahydrofolate cyclo-ligase [Steroidobacteraceae bacterium]|nr:5-formyltetrahydrofolate cyclo-ligase [Steroidobacteraceae bacterium]
MRVAPPSSDSDRKVLRRRLLALRRDVPAPLRRDAASRATAHARRCGLLAPGRSIGLYVAMRTEFDTGPLRNAALSLGCHVFVPRIVRWRGRRMQFLRQHAGGRLHFNRYGLAEPAARSSRPLAARRFDVVFVPLVGIDPTGTRLGMGGGYYDRYFAFRRRHRALRKPRLIGLAYDFQRVPFIERAPWDVPLDGVLTESGFYRTGHSRAGWGEPR